MRLSIAGLLGLVAVAAVGLTGLTRPTQLWADATFSLALMVNFAAVVAIVASGGRRRKVAAGFAICGWGYLQLSLGPWFDSKVSIYLITTHLITWGYRQNLPDPFSFARIVHSLFSIVSGLAGGWFAWSLVAKHDPDRPIANITVHQ